MDFIKGLLGFCLAALIAAVSLLFGLIWNGFWIVASILAFWWAFNACFGGN